MSSGSYSANQNKDDYGQGGYGQYSNAFNDGQPSQDGMTTQPSVGRFTEKERANSMFSRKPATPVLPPANTSMLSQDSSSQSSSGGIVNLRAPPRAEGKVSAP